VPAARKGQRGRFLRYAASSALATGVSAVVFALGYRWLGLGATGTSVTAFVSGALVNFTVNRLWAWDRHRVPGLGRDALSYSVVSLVTAGAATGSATITEWYAVRIGASPGDRAGMVEIGYFSTYLLLFVVKFVLLDRVVFRPFGGLRGKKRVVRPRRSRHQVRSTTRA
jgi:putative flippase GtrA